MIHISNSSNVSFLERIVGSEKNRLFCTSRQTTARTNCRWAVILPLTRHRESSRHAARRVCRSMQSRTRRTWCVCPRVQSDAVAGCTRTPSLFLEESVVVHRSGGCYLMKSRIVVIWIVSWAQLIYATVSDAKCHCDTSSHS